MVQQPRLEVPPEILQNAEFLTIHIPNPKRERALRIVNRVAWTVMGTCASALIVIATEQYLNRKNPTKN